MIIKYQKYSLYKFFIFIKVIFNFNEFQISRIISIINLLLPKNGLNFNGKLFNLEFFSKLKNTRFHLKCNYLF